VAAHKKYDYDADLIVQAAQGAASQAEVAARAGIEPTSLSKWLRRNPEVRDLVLAAIGKHLRPVQAGTDRLVHAERRETFDDVPLGDIEQLLVSRGLRRDDWSVARARVNRWGSCTCPQCGTEVDGLEQLRVDLDPRRDVLMPARTDGPRYPAPKHKLKPGDRVAFLADPHAPFDDPGCLAAFLAWMDEIGGVQKIVILGDVLDLPGPSQHRNIGRVPSTQECLEAAWRWLHTIRQAAPRVPMVWVTGNHDARIRHYAIDRAPELAGLKQVNGGPELLGLTHVLRLDELAVELVDHEHGWNMNELEITPSLAAWHEPPSKRQLDVIRYSVVHAHLHAQQWRTMPILGQGNETVGRRLVVGAGTMADFRTGMNYAKAPGWTQGWAWADLWDDDEHEVSHVRYRNGQAMWPGGRLKVKA
jgi:hypothetical protein